MKLDTPTHLFVGSDIDGYRKLNETAKSSGHLVKIEVNKFMKLAIV